MPADRSRRWIYWAGFAVFSVWIFIAGNIFSNKLVYTIVAAISFIPMIIIAYYELDCLRFCIRKKDPAAWDSISLEWRLQWPKVNEYATSRLLDHDPEMLVCKRNFRHAQWVLYASLAVLIVATIITI